MVSTSPPDRSPRPARRNRPYLRTTVWFAAAGLLLLVALLAAEPTVSLRAVLSAVAAAGALLAATVGVVRIVVLVVLRSVRRETESQIEAVQRRNDTTASALAARLEAGFELGLLGAVPPAQALGVVLGNIYGSSTGSSEVVTSLLGGEGLQLDRSDLTISEHTDVEYRLNRVDVDNYQLFMQVSYSFKSRVPVDKFVIFATSDAVLRESIVLGCRQPLFELWFVPDDPVSPLFHESVDGMLPSVRIGLTFVDEAGNSHDMQDRVPTLTEVRVGRWPEHLTFFREPLGTMPRLRPEDFMGSLRVFEIDLRRILGPHVQLSTVQRLTLQSMTLQRVDDGFCYWQAPYPCYIERMQIDAASLALDDGRDDFVFRVQSFAFRSQTSPARWSPPEHIKELDVRSWLLPGHGVVLLWKRVADDGNSRR